MVAAKKILSGAELESGEWIKIASLISYGFTGMVSEDVKISKGEERYYFTLPHPDIAWDEKGDIYVRKSAIPSIQ